MKNKTKDERDIFITYGYFIDLEKLRPLSPENRRWYVNKPDGGVWASPEESNWGWRDWCRAECWNTRSLKTYTRWKLKDLSRIYIIAGKRDLQRLQQRYPLKTKAEGGRDNPALDTLSGIGLWREKGYIDWYAMKEGGWDGVWLTDEGENETRCNFDPVNLYGWDCESLVVWNPEQIEIIEKGRL